MDAICYLFFIPQPEHLHNTTLQHKPQLVDIFERPIDGFGLISHPNFLSPPQLFAFQLTVTQVVVLLFAVQDAKKWMMTTKVNPTFRDC
jgi:hypothetical protein